MADEIRLVTFEGENVAPVNDALMWNAAIGDSGVIYGCETTLKNASTLHIAAGYGVICGRHFQIFESDIHVTLSSTGDLLGRLYVHMDLSDATEPIQLLIETAASLSPEEQDDNINIINGVWDMNLATFALNALTISNLQNVFSTVAGGGSSLIAGTETGATASQAYVAGQYIIWGSRLWEVIAPIASGDAFVIGSNLSTTSTTVGSELTQLNNSLTALEEEIMNRKPVYSFGGLGYTSNQAFVEWSFANNFGTFIPTLYNRSSTGTNMVDNEYITVYYRTMDAYGNGAYTITVHKDCDRIKQNGIIEHLTANTVLNSTVGEGWGSNDAYIFVFNCYIFYPDE